VPTNGVIDDILKVVWGMKIIKRATAVSTKIGTKSLLKLVERKSSSVDNDIYVCI
jgi:hypothetical protein